ETSPLRIGPVTKSSRCLTLFHVRTGSTQAERPAMFGCRASSVTSARMIALCIERFVKTRQQALLPQRLAEVADRAIANDPGLDRLVGIGGHEDDRCPMTAGGQLALQIDPAHARHLNVGDEARRRGDKVRIEKGLRGREGVDMIAQHTDQVFRRFSDGIVVIDDDDERCLCQTFRSSLAASLAVPTVTNDGAGPSLESYLGISFMPCRR